ncbi:MAG: thermosome subunit beta [Candidatus Jordarchaeaceae archaeon]
MLKERFSSDPPEKWSTLRENVSMVRTVEDFIKSSFGPTGLSKLIVNDKGEVAMTRDGFTILERVGGGHPAVRILKDAVKAQDLEFGDGTKTIVVLAGELLGGAEKLVNMGLHPTTIIRGYSVALKETLKILEEIAIPINTAEKEILKKVATNSIAGKFTHEECEHLSGIVVDAVSQITRKTGENAVFDVKKIVVEKKLGGVVTDSELVRGIIVNKEVAHRGMPRRVENAKIAVLSCPLEIEKTEFDTKIIVKNPEQIKDFLQEEESILRQMVNKLTQLGVNVVFSEKGIDDLVQYHLASMGILAAEWVEKNRIQKIASATGAQVVADINDLLSEDLGTAGVVREREFGEEKIIIVEDCKNPLALTVLLRGAAQSILNEAERAVRDAVLVLKEVLENPAVLVGGGAAEAEVSKRIRNKAYGEGKEQLVFTAFAEALEALPALLAKNLGLDMLAKTAELRMKHECGEIYAGIDFIDGETKNLKPSGVYESLSVKTQALKSAYEAATTILRIDDIIAAEKLTEKESEELDYYHPLKEVKAHEKAFETILNNISTFTIIADAVKPCFGPKGRNKLLIDNIGSLKYTSHGATILAFMYLQHPAAKMLVDLTEAQSKNLGDGTKASVILAGELLKNAEELLGQKVHPSIIINGYRKATQKSLELLNRMALPINSEDEETLKKIALTTIGGRLPEGKELFAEMAVKAIKILTAKKDTSDIDVRKIKILGEKGRSLNECELFPGVILEREVVNPKMPKRVEQAKIALLDCWLRISQQIFRRKLEVRIEDTKNYNVHLDTLNKLAEETVEKIKSAGANVVLCTKVVDELTEHFLTKSGILTVTQLPSMDLKIISEAADGKIVTDLNDLKEENLANAELVEEKKIGEKKKVFVHLSGSNCATILIRGATQEIISEAEGMLLSLLKTLKTVTKESKVVAGGGATEIELAKEIKEYAKKFSGKEQLAIERYAKALEAMPKTLAENAGLNTIDSLAQLRALHQDPKNMWMGITQQGKLEDTKKLGILEPLNLKKQIIESAKETAETILRIDEIIMEKEKPQKKSRKPKGNGYEKHTH